MLLGVVSSSPLPFAPPAFHEPSQYDSQEPQVQVTKEVSHVTFQVSEVGPPPVIVGHEPSTIHQTKNEETWLVRPEDHIPGLMVEKKSEEDPIELDKNVHEKGHLESIDIDSSEKYEEISQPEKLVQSDDYGSINIDNFAKTEEEDKKETTKHEVKNEVNLSENKTEEQPSFFEEILEEAVTEIVDDIEEIIKESADTEQTHDEFKQKSHDANLNDSEAKFDHDLEEFMQSDDPMSGHVIDDDTIINDEHIDEEKDETKSESSGVFPDDTENVDNDNEPKGENRESRIFSGDLDDYENQSKTPIPAPGELKLMKYAEPTKDSVPPLVFANEPSSDKSEPSEVFDTKEKSLLEQIPEPISPEKMEDPVVESVVDEHVHSDTSLDEHVQDFDRTTENVKEQIKDEVEKEPVHIEPFHVEPVIEQELENPAEHIPLDSEEPILDESIPIDNTNDQVNSNLYDQEAELDLPESSIIEDLNDSEEEPEDHPVVRHVPHSDDELESFPTTTSSDIFHLPDDLPISSDKHFVPNSAVHSNEAR